MSDTTLIPPSEDKTPRSYGTEPPRNVEYATLPPDITLKPEAIAFRRPLFTGSVLIMVLTALITFWLPFFNGLLAGSFGGYHAGRMRRALAAAAVCSVAVPALLAFLNLFSEQPSLLFLMGLSFKEWIIAHILGTFLGAIGGAACRPLVTEREMYRYYV